MNDGVLTIAQADETTVVLTLNRPERRNALSIQLMETLCETLKALASKPQVRVVILRGAGPAFCAGLDLVEAAQPEHSEHSAHCVSQTFQTVGDMPQITIAAVHGAAFAGGAGLMASCDFVVAAADLRVCFPEVRRGLVPALAAVALGERLRDGDRRELLLLGEPIDAQRALLMGLVDRVVPTEELMTTACQLAASAVKGGPQAVLQTKRLLRELEPGDRLKLFGRALEFHNWARKSEESQEGLAAFHEHREPVWPASVE